MCDFEMRTICVPAELFVGLMTGHVAWVDVTDLTIEDDDVVAGERIRVEEKFDDRDIPSCGRVLVMEVTNVSDVGGETVYRCGIHCQLLIASVKLIHASVAESLQEVSHG